MPIVDALGQHFGGRCRGAICWLPACEAAISSICRSSRTLPGLVVIDEDALGAFAEQARAAVGRVAHFRQEQFGEGQHVARIVAQR